MECPVCKKEVEESFKVYTQSMEPFTCVAIEPTHGLFAWGGYGVARTVFCANDEYVHFKFDHSGEEHLVLMVKYNPEAIGKRHQYHEEHPQPCEHEGCEEQGIACYMLPLDEDPNEWLCVEHMQDGGYCYVCQLFKAGTEAFDFSEAGLCGSCQEQIADEEYDFDYDDDEWHWFDDYSHSWHDPDLPMDDEESTGKYIGPESIESGE